MKRNFSLFCILFAIAANLFSAAKAQVNTTDSLALVDLYNSTNGPNWYDHTNWLTSKPVSTWHGITVTNNSVTNIFLDYNNMSGTLPSSIGNLVHLQEIFLYSNQLSGALPAEIGNLVNLTYLDVSHNQISGVIPATFGNLILLQHAYLNNNQLSGAIPATMGNLANLVELFLYNNQLSGAIPAEIGKLVKLYYLQLNGNHLSGTIPAELGNLVLVTGLYLNNNQLSGVIPSTIGQLVNLQQLNWSYNKLTGAIPAEIGNLTRINYLYFNNNQLSGAIPSTIGNLTSLAGLYLDHNRLSGGIPASISKLKTLYNIDLSHNLLSENKNITFSTYNNTYSSTAINNNLFTFNGLESLTPKYRNLVYAPQNTILHLHQTGNSLSVSAGGTVSNNTYKWFTAGSVNFTTINGDSMFTPSTNGKYYAMVTNAVATQLTLRTDTINYVMTAAQQSSHTFIAKVAQPATNIQPTLVYPNPANSTIYIQVNGSAIITLTNSAGKILVSKTITTTGEINISRYANGVYSIQNKSTGSVQKVVVVH